ncbi:Carnitine O-acetyltransferase mitochondrial, partial [Coemansia nantahalensis]
MYTALSLLKPAALRLRQSPATMPALVAARSRSTAAAQAKQAGGSAPGKLYAFQAQLPKLPVPTLDETLPKYLRTVEPLLSKEDFARTRAVVEEFGQSAEGRVLQNRLEARAAEPGRANWLEEWWNDLSYMG